MIHFELCADNPDWAIGFYTSVFWWQVQKAEMPGIDYRLVTTGPDDQPGINGAVMPRRHPAAKVTNDVDVSSVDEYTPKIEADGATVAMPKMAIPGVGYAAACVDTEGNAFGLFQDDPTAR